jgi:hypothetical protein
MNKNIVSILITFVFIWVFTSCKENKTGIAIVVDTQSYNAAQQEIDAYADVLESEGLKPYLIVKDYSVPDSLKNELIALYHSTVPIEGAVFIGDIPIIMAIDAQHMTSAFKMDQKRFGIKRACVPTDRFYDDFNLDFDFIKQDSINKLRYYYSLNFESKQVISPNIYSGRIKAPEVENKYELLKKYLKKVIEQHKIENKVDEFFFFAGSGYNSESMMARLDEQYALKQQLPGNPNISFLDHSMEKIIKFPYMSELQREDLDIGLLHHHGSKSTEYLSGAEKVDGYKQQIAQVKRYLRGVIYEAENKNEIKEIKEYYKEKFNIPSSWFDGAFNPRVEKHDSAYAANLNLTLKDFSYYTPNLRFAIFDACYNGSFHRDEYLAGAYIFGDGNTVAAQGNTVNSLQDKWPQEMIGLLSLGMRVGEWSRKLCYLETHIIGDPTFRFTSIDPSINVHQLSVNNSKNNRFWKKQLKSKYADVQVFALRSLYENNSKDISNLLSETYKKSDYASVRTECLILLSKINDNNYTEILKLAMFDDYELTQRFAVKMAEKKGGDELISSIIKLSFMNLSARVEFNLENALSFFDKEKLLAEFDKQSKDVNFLVHKKMVNRAIRRFLENSDRRFNIALETIADTSSSDKNMYKEIRGLRNSNYHQGVDTFLNFITTSTNQEHRKMMLESLGWFTLSSEKQKIVEFCNKIYENEAEIEDIRKEARKTLLRLN